MRSPAIMPFAALLLASCGPGENDPGPGGVTVGEARALDEAAAMLDERRSPLDTAGNAPVAPAPSSPQTAATPADPNREPVR